MALVLALALGWPSREESRTVFVTVPAATPVAEPARSAGAKVSRRPAFDATRIYAERSAGVVTVYALFDSDADAIDGHGAQGSGFVVSPRGYVLTNAHVITGGSGARRKPAVRLYVEFEDGDRISAKIVGWDVYNDVGLIRVDPRQHRLTPVPLGDSSRVRVGEPVAAIGSPFGRQNTLTVGVVSATRRAISSLSPDFDLVDAIQTDAAINHGNSGGPLFDAAGRVVGINAQIRSESGVSEGVGFAVPINSAKRSMRQLLRAGSVSYAYVGISTDDLTPALARRFGYAAPYGAVVACVTDGSPAEAAGLRAGSTSDSSTGPSFIEGGDVIVAIDGQPVRSSTDVVRAISQRLSPGAVATFTILRGTGRIRVPVTLAARPSDPSGCEP